MFESEKCSLLNLQISEMSSFHLKSAVHDNVKNKVGLWNCLTMAKTNKTEFFAVSWMCPVQLMKLNI